MINLLLDVSLIFLVVLVVVIVGQVLQSARVEQCRAVGLHISARNLKEMVKM